MQKQGKMFLAKTRQTALALELLYLVTLLDISINSFLKTEFALSSNHFAPHLPCNELLR